MTARWPVQLPDRQEVLRLRPDIAAVYQQLAFGINADEDARPGDVSRFIDDRPFFERHQRRFDFAKALIDFVRQLVGVLIIELQLGLLGIERVDGRLLLDGEIG
jgi:hypothetical protein